jgi:methyl-accepting chemotaxis protein
MNSNKVRFSLRTKAIIACGAVTLIVGLALTWQSDARIRALAEQQLKALGRDAGSVFASQAEPDIMLGNITGLKAPLDDLKRNQMINYALVTDAKQKVLASTFNGEPPADVLAGLAERGGERTALVSVSGRPTIELEVPLMQGALGTAHLGLNGDFVDQIVAEQTYKAMKTLALVLLVGLGLLWIFINRMVRPVITLTEITRRIVEEGDLTQEVRVQSDDEVGVLSRHFAAMVDRLRQIPRELAKNAQLLKQAVAALEEATAAQNAVVTRQATALQETQVTAEEIRQTSRVASRSADGILQDIARAEAAGEKGALALEESLKSLGDILASVRATSSSIGDLGERTRQIGGITNTVKDLADQSNMLALNAAIEAVRSGEHGKGFALVAREIRRLADQSIQSTERVREILNSVGGAVSSAVAGSEDGARRVEASLDQMRSSSEHLRALALVVRDTSSAVRQIAGAVSQQDTGVNQVFAAVVDQNKMMEESMQQLRGTLNAVNTLQEVSSGLAEVLGRYKV